MNDTVRNYIEHQSFDVGGTIYSFIQEEMKKELAKNKFYGILDEETHTFVHYVDFRYSSSLKNDVILDVAPSSATFFNFVGDVADAMKVCQEKYPNKTFYVKTFNY